MATIPAWPFAVAAAVAFVALVTLAVVSADHNDVRSGSIHGSGVGATVRREVAPFTGVDLAGTNSLTVHVGSPRSVTVTGDDNLLDRVTTAVRGGTFVVGDRGNFTTKKPMRVTVSVPSLDRATLRGTGAVVVDGVTGGDFAAELGGTGTLQVSGTVDRATAVLSGSGRLDLHHLVAADATARLDGTGSILVHATSALDATLTGTGSIVYSGAPAVTTHQTGTGSISPESGH